MCEQIENELINVAMQIILHAGNARVKITEALEKAKLFDFSSCESLIQEAEEEIHLAHKSQTEIIQGEASGKHYEYSLLFAHAQDTLMTINSEIRLSKQMIDILKLIKENK